MSGRAGGAVGFLRIIAGELGGRRIRTPRGDQVRPTADRVREALFSIVGARVVGARVLDAFAGTGALGLEALSRGAREVVFVESARPVLRLLRENVEALGMASRSVLVHADAVRALAEGRVEGAFGLILADPPYASPDAGRFVEAVASGTWLAPGGWLVLEGPAASPAPPGGTGLKHARTARYGDTSLDFYSP